MFKRGYCVAIDTYENDGDYPKTTYFDGLTLDAAKAYTEFAKFFYSIDSKRTNMARLGNAKVDFNSGGLRDDTVNTSTFQDGYFKPYMDNEFPEIKIPEKLLWKEDTIYDVIGFWDEGRRLRVVDDIRAYFVPEAVPEISI